MANGTQNQIAVGSKVIYHGESGGGVMYGEHCKVVELIPHGTYFGKDGRTLDPQPTEFDPNLNRYIGEWLGVESTDEDGLLFAAPRGWFHPAA